MHTPGVTTPILESFSNGELPTSFRSSDGRIAGGRPPPPAHPPPACPPHSSHRGGFQGGMMGGQPPGFRQDGRGGFMPGNSRGGYHGAARFDPYGESLSLRSLSQTRVGVNCRCRCACASPRPVTTLSSPAMLSRRRQHLPALPLWCAPDSRDMTAVAHAHATAGRGRGGAVHNRGGWGGGGRGGNQIGHSAAGHRGGRGGHGGSDGGRGGPLYKPSFVEDPWAALEAKG